MAALTALSASVMAQYVRERKVSPVELIEAHLDRTGRLNPKLNAFAHLDAEGARAQARVAEEQAQSGAQLGALLDEGEIFHRQAICLLHSWNQTTLYASLTPSVKGRERPR